MHPRRTIGVDVLVRRIYMLIVAGMVHIHQLFVLARALDASRDFRRTRPSTSSFRTYRYDLGILSAVLSDVMLRYAQTEVSKSLASSSSSRFTTSASLLMHFGTKSSITAQASSESSRSLSESVKSIVSRLPQRPVPTSQDRVSRHRL